MRTYISNIITSVCVALIVFPDHAQATSSVVGRWLFYNQCTWDGNNTAANSSDDSAIAPDKEPLFSGQRATFKNYSTFGRGINGIMVDISGLPGTPTAADFEFRVGRSSDLATWSTAPTPTAVAVRTGAGTGGSDRVTITWASSAIKNRWLEVKVLATADTGLTTPDTFYFGSVYCDTGDSPDDTLVTNMDLSRMRAAVANSAALSNVYDCTRDNRVNSTDINTLRLNLSTASTEVPLLDLTSAAQASE